MSRRSARYAQLIELAGREAAHPRMPGTWSRRRICAYSSTSAPRNCGTRPPSCGASSSTSINHYHREHSTPLVAETIDELDRRGVLVDPAAGPEQTLAAEQEFDRVVRLLTTVSPRACQIFIAQRGGYSYEEIAAASALKPRTFEKHVATAALALTEMIPPHTAVPRS